jgi:hypothetical protein
MVLFAFDKNSTKQKKPLEIVIYSFEYKDKYNIVVLQVKLKCMHPYTLLFNHFSATFGSFSPNIYCTGNLEMSSAVKFDVENLDQY